MSTPESNDAVICPQCNAQMPAEAKRCRLCGVPLRPTAANPVEPAPIVEPRKAYQFGLSTLLLAMTMIAVLSGMFAIHPGIGLAFTLLATPPLIRTCIVTAKRKKRGQPMSSLAKLGIFASTLGIVVVVVFASIVAFFAVCFTLLANNV